MSKITLFPPAEGSVVSVPLGQSKVFTVSGVFNALLADGVFVTVTAEGRVSTASVDLNQHSFQSAITLSCPSVVAVKATLHTLRWVETPHGHWVTSSIGSNTVTITVQDISPDPLYLIVCRCVDSSGRPLVGLQIEAFDQDPRTPDDKLGATATTDVDGLAEFRFRHSTFTEHPGERYPDVYFRITRGGRTLSYNLPGERNDRGVLRNFQPRSTPVVVHVPDVRGYVVQGAIRAKWLSLGAHTGLLGLPVTDELPTPDGRGRFNHFEGGSIYWTPEWGAFEVHGLIRQKWADLGWEQDFLGFPVTDELSLPGSNGGRYSLFEHGIVTWERGQAEALAGPHHYERIYADVRAQILSRHFAIGNKGRRNLPSFENVLKGPVQVDPTTREEREEADRARWRIIQNNVENPHLYGSWLHVALAIEHDAGNDESGRVLEASLATLDTLFTWAEPRAEGTSRLPQRWDAGLPTDFASEAKQFLDGGNGAYSTSLPASNPHHYARRTSETLEKLLGPTEAAAYRRYQQSPDDDKDPYRSYCQRYRAWELSMDEITGLVTSYWIIGKLSRSISLTSTVRRQASLLGNYLANNGYILVRPMGGVSWRGAMGVLPALEYPFSRALSAVTGADFTSRTDFRGAMIRAGYWPLLEGPIDNAKAMVGLDLPGVLLILGPAAPLLGLTVAGIQAVLAGQVISHSTLAGALGVFLGSDCFDVAEQGEAAAALLFRDAPNKAGLYGALAINQAESADVKTWSVNFHSWIGLTGVDDADATVRDTFASWFNLRQSHPGLEPKGYGSRSLFAAGVAVLVGNDTAAEERLVAGLEQAIVELFRNSYFEPRLLAEGSREFCWYGVDDYREPPRKPYGPLDLMVATALAFWHAKRRSDAGNPVSTPRFPQPLLAGTFANWPKAAVPKHCLDALQEVGIPIEAIQGSSEPKLGPDGYGLFELELPLVPRRPAPAPPSWKPANQLLCDTTIPVRAADAGEVATGVTLRPGHDIEIVADGDIWAGVPLDSRNGPEGLPRPINDARWPLHTGIDPAANAFCLLGRLNGYFRIGSALPRTKWVYPEERPLFLRINDSGPGDGNGQFNVRIRVWGPADCDPSSVFRPVSVLRDGGVLRTSDPDDLIEVTVTPSAVTNDAVEFELLTPDNITWRKEIVIGYNPTIGGSVTIWTQDSKHRDANGLYLNELPGATLTFRKEKGFFGGGVRTQLVLGGLEAALPDSRITFCWVRD
jgi:hypothetical protein